MVLRPDFPSRRIKVVLLYDRPGWIIDSIAREIARHSDSAYPDIDFSVAPASTNPVDIYRICASCDVLHFLTPWHFFAISRLCWKPVVVTVHHVTQKGEELLPIHQQYADVVCTTNLTAQSKISALINVPLANLHLIRYGLDTEKFRRYGGGRQSLQKQLGVDMSCFLIGFSAAKFSNQEDRKATYAYWELVRALKANASFVFKLALFGPAGDGPKEWSITDIPEDIRDHVALVGYLQQDQVPIMMSGLDVYMCLSRIEGGPYPVLESMACEVPVISTRVGIVPEVIDNGVSGLLVDHEAAVAQAADLVIRIGQQGLQMANMVERARERVVEHHSWGPAVRASRLDVLYRNAIENCHARRWNKLLARASCSGQIMKNDLHRLLSRRHGRENGS